MQQDFPGFRNLESLSRMINLNPYLFVYGTLRLNAGNEVAQFLHRNASFVGVGKMPGELFDLGAYPGAKYVENAPTWVAGDVFKMHDANAVLRVLDEYEGICPDCPLPHEYIRVQKPIQMGGAEQICWVYLYNSPAGGWLI